MIPAASTRYTMPTVIRAGRMDGLEQRQLGDELHEEQTEQRCIASLR